MTIPFAPEMFCGPPPPAPTNGGLSTYSASSSSSVVQFPTFGTVVEYTCGEGRRLFTEEEGMHDTTAVQCQWDGTWNPPEVRICQCRKPTEQWTTVRSLATE